MIRTACLGIWLGVLAASTGAQAQERFALIMGANAGWSNDRPLRYAESDAERMRDVLVELGGFAADRVQLLQDPDTSQVRAALHTLSEKIRELDGQALLFFYYAGHADEQQLHLRGPSLTHEELLELLRESAGELRIGVVDACRSGSILASRGNGRGAPFTVGVVDELEANGFVVLSASGAEELSQGSRALAGSVFTHHLVSGLRGAADRDGDGQVTLSEAYEHALRRTRADTADTPSPQAGEPRGQEFQGDGAVVLTRLAAGSATLVLPPGEGERYVVVDRYEWRLVAEARSLPERQVRLVLPPGEYRLKRVGEQRLDVAAVQLSAGDLVELSELDFKPRSLSSGLLKGRPDRSHVVEALAWRRSEGWRLLAAGEARAALRLFNRILEEVPDDVAARRGRGRALVLLSETYARSKDATNERKALRAALVSDPALAEDPAFQQRYEPMKKAVDDELKQYQSYRRSEAELRENPRLGRSWGLGFDVFGPRGGLPILGNTRGLPLSGFLVLKGSLFPYATIDFAAIDVGGGVRWAIRPKRWSPFVGAGFSWARLSLAGADPQADRPSFLVHVDGGFQFVGQNGIGIEAGGGLIIYKNPSGGVAGELVPLFGLQWLF